MKILLLVFAFFISIFASAQIDTISGKAYRYVQYYNENNPFISGTFTLKKTWKKIDNAYKLTYVPQFVRQNELKYGIWIIDNGNFFYLNIYRYGYGFPKCFVKFEKKGNYYYFKAPPRMTAAQQDRLAKSQLMYGLVGFVGTSNRIDKENSNRWHCVLNFSTGSIRTLSVEYITDLLENYPQLYKEFNNEIDKSRIKTLKAYLEKINNEKILSPTPN